MTDKGRLLTDGTNHGTHESHDGVTGEFRANRTIKELTGSWIGFNVAGYH